jgi:hypothetical protein
MHAGNEGESRLPAMFVAGREEQSATLGNSSVMAPD